VEESTISVFEEKLLFTASGTEILNFRFT